MFDIKNEVLKSHSSRTLSQLKPLVIALVTLLLFSNNMVLAQSTTLSGVAQNIMSSFSDLAKLITAAAYIGGLGFAFAAILKFKEHKDMPQQTGIGKPISLLFIGAALLFLPMVFSVAGSTLFGTGGTAGGISGTTSLPGFSG